MTTVSSINAYRARPADEALLEHNIPLTPEQYREHTVWSKWLDSEERQTDIYWNNLQANLFTREI